MEITDFFAGIITSTLAGLGIGGGGLLVIYLSLFSGIGQLSAQGINLIFFLFSSGASLLVHIKKRRIPFAVFAVTSLGGIIGALIGSSIASVIDPELIRRLFGALLIFSGLSALFAHKNKNSKAKKKVDS